MTDTPPHIALAIERVKEIANGANKITEAELQSLCALAIKALIPPPPGQYDDLVNRLRSIIADGDANGINATIPTTIVLRNAIEQLLAAITDMQQQVRYARWKALQEAEQIAYDNAERWNGYGIAGLIRALKDK